MDWLVSVACLPLGFSVVCSPSVFLLPRVAAGPQPGIRLATCGLHRPGSWQLAFCIYILLSASTYFSPHCLRRDPSLRSCLSQLGAVILRSQPGKTGQLPYLGVFA